MPMPISALSLYLSGIVMPRYASPFSEFEERDPTLPNYISLLTKYVLFAFTFFFWVSTENAGDVQHAALCDWLID